MQHGLFYFFIFFLRLVISAPFFSFLFFSLGDGFLGDKSQSIGLFFFFSECLRYSFSQELVYIQPRPRVRLAAGKQRSRRERYRKVKREKGAFDGRIGHFIFFLFT